MAPSFRDLIDFLLAEIALCGDQGASPADILSFIDEFYAQPTEPASNRSHAVDRKFQEKVWQWLMKNPEVSVGKDRQGNYLTLADAEQRQTQPAAGDAAKGSSNTSENVPVRVFVSKERTWLAVTGHEPNETKVLPTEFALLSIIASRKSEGIVQTELVRLSGQDKRSVPKRTVMLQQKGYIEKRAIQIKSARTSLCTLRRFLKPESVSNETPPDQALGTTDGTSKIIDFKQFTQKIFEILREYKVISRNDLKTLLGFADPWRWRILSRALRKFERIGVLKRVRALSQYADTMRKYHPCIMLIRDPSEKDIAMFYEYSQNIYTNMEQGSNADFDEDLETDDVTGGPSSGVSRVKSEESVEESGRTIPLWTPDRNIHNQIFDVVDAAGTVGTTNIDVIRACFGGFYRRPLENTLARLVECWQLSQPPHLRHLAIVRDTALQRTITHYIHYSARNFAKLVDAGEATWEAVEFVPKNPKTDNLRVLPVDAKPQLDEYGLPEGIPSKELVKNGNSSLLECILAAKPPDYVRSSSDPVVIQLEDGTFTVNNRRTNLPVGTSPHHKLDHSRRDLQATSSKLKFDSEDRSDINMDDGEVAKLRRPRKSIKDSEKFQGMSEKERLEALGLDETWTEYSVLLMERPTPGIYITPKGRRRPAGKRQGRPRVSRLAVFKSPKLFAFPWFEKNQEEANELASVPQPSFQEQGTELSSVLEPVGTGVETPQLVETDTVRGTKRSLQRRASDNETEHAVAPKMRRISKTEHRSLNNTNGTVETDINMKNGKPRQQSSTDVVRSTARKGVKRTRVLSPETYEQNISSSSILPDEEPSQDQDLPQPLETPSKRPRKGTRTPQTRKALSKGLAPDRAQDSVESHLGPPEILVAEDLPTQLSVSEIGGKDTPSHPQMPEKLVIADDASKNQEVQTVQQIPSPKSNEIAPRNDGDMGPSISETPVQEVVLSNIQTPDSKLPKGRRSKTDKGGTVSFLRKKIVMDIIDKAGGAYPMGSEIWYPFMTAWMKTKYKEKPDLRTIKTSIKHLVDAGKLRQQTFCGKDTKGVMVTKTIVCLSHLQPDDPIIKTLQQNMLDSETRYYFPPNVEIDPDLTKSGERATPSKEIKTPNQLPVESGITVQLHQKPAFVLALEKRRGQSIQRKLLQRIQVERTAHKQGNSKGVVRLLTLQHAGGDLHGMTSFSRPDHISFDGMQRTPRRRRADGPGGSVPRRIKRLLMPISSIAPYAMLMSPKQVFHPETGTFSTNSGLTALTMSSAATRKSVPHIPDSLDDLFSQTRRRAMREHTDPRSKKFYRDIDAILKWEIENEELLQNNTGELRYINQTMQDSFETVPIEGAIRFDDGWAEPIMPEPSHMITRRRADRSPSIDESSSSSSPPPFVVDTSYAYLKPTSLPQHRRLEKLNEIMANDSTTGVQPSSVRQPNRRNRLAQPLPRPLLQKIMTAIVVVRTLAGGLEGRVVDWTLVAKCIPDQDSKFIQDRGKGILNRQRLQLSKMQSDFQEHFIEAYMNGQVPPINYDDLESYDWDMVVRWANTQLDVPKSEKLPDLPATREQFDCLFEIREEPLSSVDDVYQGNNSSTVNRKRSLFASIPFSTPLEYKRAFNPQRQVEIARVEAAKTWIRANVLTPEETYNPTDARNTLSYFGNTVLYTALQSLVTERVISQGNRGRVTPGRNYDITEHFLYVLSKKRAIEGTELRRATRFKRNILDPALRRQGTFDIAYGAEDGDILAVINLFAQGRVTVHPRDPPRDPFGLTDGGYLTRQMNKDKLRFAVEVHPVKGSYIEGEPVRDKLSSVPPPCPGRIDAHPMISVPEKIPLWCDIHGGFIKVLWELAVAAVVGCIAIRPGITAEGIANMVKPTIGAWETRLLLQWTTDVGVTRQEGRDISGEPGWVVQEWWWTVLG